MRHWGIILVLTAFPSDLVYKVTLKMVVITGFFLLCVTPVCIMWILVGVTLDPEDGKLFNGPFVIVFLNSLVEPFLYLGICRSLRKAFAQTFCKALNLSLSSSSGSSWAITRSNEFQNCFVFMQGRHCVQCVPSLNLLFIPTFSLPSQAFPQSLVGQIGIAWTKTIKFQLQGIMMAFHPASWL